MASLKIMRFTRSSPETFITPLLEMQPGIRSIHPRQTWTAMGPDSSGRGRRVVADDRVLNPEGLRYTDEFVRRLEAKGISTTIRDTRGDEIDAACGQLAAAP